MDWPRARAILLVAFTVVNLILAYSIWAPSEVFSGLSEPPHLRTVDQVRARLLDSQLILPQSVTVPRTPGSMHFLHVEYRPTPDLLEWPSESFGNPTPYIGRLDPAVLERLKPTLDPATQAVIYHPNGTGSAAHEVRLDNRTQVHQVAEEYLRQSLLLPPGAYFDSVRSLAEGERAEVEFVPHFDGYPVFSGYVRTEVSGRGIETVSRFWVQPVGYTDAAPKSVRPATEALLRLAGRLTGKKKRTIVDIQLGYYAGRELISTQTDAIKGWDTVPVWRISLDSGEVYYINAFNGEWES